MPYTDNVWYHGTNSANISSIMEYGILPTFKNAHSMTKFYDGVYLSQTPRYARSMGSAVFEIKGIDETRLLPDSNFIEQALAMYRRHKIKAPVGLSLFKKYVEKIKKTPHSGQTILSEFDSQELRMLNIYADEIGLDTFVYIGNIPSDQILLMQDETNERPPKNFDIEIGYDPQKYNNDRYPPAANDWESYFMWQNPYGSGY